MKAQRGVDDSASRSAESLNHVRIFAVLTCRPDVTSVPVLQTMEEQPGSWRQRGREILQIQQPEHEQSA